MATRTNDLTEFAKPTAERLATRCGSLKMILSAGVLALDDLSAEKREEFMAKASGPVENNHKEPIPEEEKSSPQPTIREVLRLVTLKDNKELASHIKLLTSEDQKIIREFRKSVSISKKKTSADTG